MVISVSGGHKNCRRPIRMSLLCQIDMTLPRMFREVSGVTVRVMSDKELARLEVLRDLDQQRLTPTAAAQLLGLERRQVFRLLGSVLIRLGQRRASFETRPAGATQDEVFPKAITDLPHA